jgi:hypothetical protein
VQRFEAGVEWQLHEATTEQQLNNGWSDLSFYGLLLRHLVTVKSLLIKLKIKFPRQPVD